MLLTVAEDKTILIVKVINGKEKKGKFSRLSEQVGKPDSGRRERS